MNAIQALEQMGIPLERTPTSESNSQRLDIQFKPGRVFVNGKILNYYRFCQWAMHRQGITNQDAFKDPILITQYIEWCRANPNEWEAQTYLFD